MTLPLVFPQDNIENPLAGGFLVKIRLLLLVSLLASHVLVAQTNQPSPPSSVPQPVQAQPTQTDFVSRKGFVLEDETPVRLRLNRTISSADAHVGDTVDFETLDDITVNGTVVVPKGGLAFATVTEAQAKRRMARGGKLDINIDYVKLVSGDKAALRAVKDVKGGGHTGGMVGGMVATSIIFFPAAPFFLFMHGKDISIPKGTEITAYVNGDVRLDLAKFQPAGAPTEAAAVNAPPENGAAFAKLQLVSDPPGADIEIDGSFVGNTPSDVQIAEGDHIVTVKKLGFKDWERKIKVNAGSNVHLNAELEKVPNP
jgi:PEGA domain